MATIRLGSDSSHNSLIGLGPFGLGLQLRFLRPVTAARLLAAIDAEGVERAAHDLITDSGEVADTAAADQYDRVLKSEAKRS